MLLVSTDGEAFEGEIKIKKPRHHNIEMNKSSPTSAFHEFLEKEEVEIIKVKRLPNVHRAVRITSDLKGRNFSVIQVSIKRNIYCDLILIKYLVIDLPCNFITHFYLTQIFNNCD